MRQGCLEDECLELGRMHRAREVEGKRRTLQKENRFRKLGVRRDRTAEQKERRFERVRNKVSSIRWVHVVTGLEQARKVCI